MIRILTILMLMSALCGCAMPPAAADPESQSCAPYEPLVNGRLVTVKVICVNGQESPGSSMDDAIAIFARHVAGEVRTVRGEPITIDTGANPLPMESQLVEHWAQRTCFSPSDITVYVTPGLMDRSLRGYCAWLSDDSHVVVLMGNYIDEAGGLFRETAWKIITAHELCHALQVPADRSHRWRDGHCTRPQCLLYPRVDCRSVLTALMRLGPPTDLCSTCRGEIRAAWKAADGKLVGAD